jgi:hypothetical protein
MSQSFIKGFGFVIALGLAMFTLARGSTTSAKTDKSEERSCTNRTLKGEYGFSAAGHLGPTEVLTVGGASFDGEGNFELRDTLKIVGGPTLPREVLGTYDIAEDCRGTATFHAPAPFEVDVTLQLVLVAHGREAYFIQVAPDAFFHGTAKQQ